MDREYIRSQRVVERYLSGDLIVREAREFETYCQEHPDVLDSLPLPARLKARLSVKPFDGTDTSVFPAIPSSITRLVAPAPMTEPAPRPATVQDDTDEDDDAPAARRHLAPIVLLGIAIVAIATLLWLRADQQQQIKTLTVQAKGIKLQAPGVSEVLRLAPSDVLPDAPQASVSLGLPKLLDVHIDVSDTKFAQYALTIDKADEARLFTIRRIAVDTNRELRFNLNSSAFGPGQYQIKLEGYDWRGQVMPAGWMLVDMR